MDLDTNPAEQVFAFAAMLIRKPISEVFLAFIDPEMTRKFWFTKGDSVLTEGKPTLWRWEMFNHEVHVLPLEILPNALIRIQWGEDPQAIVEWKFTARAKDQTFVEITNWGFKGNQEEIIAQLRDATGGFSWVLAGAKAFLEHGIELNLIADRYPPSKEG